MEIHIYPDSSDAGDCITYLYNRQLQVTGMTDQAGTAHSYGYDKLGRALTDTVSFPAVSTVDKTVGKLETVYNQRGLPLRITSYNTAGATVLNQVLREYNGFNQMITEYQEHAGTVNISTSLKVQYSYADGSVTSKTIRPTGVTYPNGDSIATNYTSDTANALSRPDEIKEGTSILASYQYLGLGTVTELKYTAASSAFLTMKGGGTGEAGDPYTGLDRFGRLAATLWKKGSEQLVHTAYGRNRNGGVTWQRNVKAHALSKATEDNFYWYDGLNQVTRHDRGGLAPSSGAPYTGINPANRQQQEIFAFDETGNWQGDYSQNPALSQGRTHNAANQITAINGPTGAIQPAYDEVGNMTTMPKAGNWTTANTLKWDAWNRLVKLTEGSNQITYAYDALTRRVSKAKTGETRRYYYDRQWRCVEERVSNAVKAQYVWSPLDRWTMIRRKRSTGSSTLNETRYVLKDYLDPTAIVDPTGTVMERYRYDAFGPVKILAPNFGPRSTSECGWNFLFHAEFLDEDSGLYNYGYRVYHPELGRWVSRDPIEEDGGMNLYEFSDNEGISKVDFLGMVPDEFNLQIYDGACLPASAANLIKLITNKEITTDQMIEAMVKASTQKLTKKDIQDGFLSGVMTEDLIKAMEQIGNVNCKISEVTPEELKKMLPAIISIEGGYQDSTHAVVLVKVGKRDLVTIIDPYPDPDKKNQKCCKPELSDMTLREIIVYRKGGVIIEGNIRRLDPNPKIKRTRVITCTKKK